MASITLQHVRHLYGSNIALDEVSLHVEDGEFLTILGPSGCGKSTLLRIVAGLERPTSGQILIDGEDVTSLGPKHRDIGMVFQNYALFPHMSVKENIAFGLRARRVSRPEVDAAVADVAALLELGEFLHRKPRQLSGGQRQRVALGRALARRPRVLLMDEPLSNLDSALRDRMRAQLRRLHHRLGVTTLYVTHDQQEALALSDRVAVMNRARIEQVGKPADVLLRPETAFTAGFVGNPPMNLLDLPHPASPEHGEVTVGIRPEDLGLACGAQRRIDLDVLVEAMEPTRDGTLLHGLWRDRPVVARLPEGSPLPHPGSHATLSAPLEQLTYFCPRTGERLARPAEALAEAQCS